MSKFLDHGECAVLRLALHRQCKNNKQRAEYLRQALLFCFGISVGRIECVNVFAAPARSKRASLCYYWCEGRKRLILDIINSNQDVSLWFKLDLIAGNIYQVFAEAYYPKSVQIKAYLRQSLKLSTPMNSKPSLLKIAWCAEYFKLTHRQAEGLCYLANGFTVKQTADQLGIQASTLKSHLNKAYKILKVNNLHDALQTLNHRVVQWIR